MENPEGETGEIQNRGLRDTPFGRIVSYLLAIIVSAVVSYYVAVFLTTSDKIEYSLAGDKRIGLIHRDGKIKLAFDDQQLMVEPGEDAVTRILNFIMINDNIIPLDEGLRFLLVYGDEKKFVPRQTVVDERVDVVDQGDDSDGGGENTGSEKILIEYKIISADLGKSKGQNTYGIELTSSVPGKTMLSFTVVMNLVDHPELTDQKIDLLQSYRKGTRLERINKSKIINIHIYDLIVWLVLTTVVYSLAWLCANIYTRNYSAGARIVDWLMRKITGRGFIKNETGGKG